MSWKTNRKAREELFTIVPKIFVTLNKKVEDHRKTAVGFMFTWLEALSGTYRLWHYNE
jgi:hypothetical protein